MDLNLDSLTHRKSKEVENLNRYGGGVLANISRKQVPKPVVLMCSTVYGQRQKVTVLSAIFLFLESQVQSLDSSKAKALGVKGQALKTLLLSDVYSHSTTKPKEGAP